MAHPPHPPNFLVIVLLRGRSQAPCGLDSKPASLKKWNSLSHLLPPTSTPGPDSEVGSPLLSLILPASHLPIHPLVLMSCLGPGYMSWTPGSVCLLPLLSSWPQPKPLQLLSCLKASVLSRRGLRFGFIQKVRTFRCEKTASPGQEESRLVAGCSRGSGIGVWSLPWSRIKTAPVEGREASPQPVTPRQLP